MNGRQAGRQAGAAPAERGVAMAGADMHIIFAAWSAPSTHPPLHRARPPPRKRRPPPSSSSPPPSSSSSSSSSSFSAKGRGEVGEAHVAVRDRLVELVSSGRSPAVCLVP